MKFKKQILIGLLIVSCCIIVASVNDTLQEDYGELDYPYVWLNWLEFGILLFACCIYLPIVMIWIRKKELKEEKLV